MDVADKIQQFATGERNGDKSFSEVLDSVWKYADGLGCRETVLQNVGACLLADTSVGAVFHFTGSRVNTDDTDLTLLASCYSSIPANVEQWATNVATRCCVSGNVHFEDSANSDTTTVRLIASPFGVTDRCEAIVVMFVGDGTNDEFQRALLKSTVKCISTWDCNRHLVHAHQVSQDLAAINELVTRIENSGSPDEASQRLADELEEYIYFRSGHDRSYEQLPTEEALPNSDYNAEVFIALANDDEKIKLVAISNTNSIPQDSPLVDYVESAMRECLSRNQASEWPPQSSGRHALLCHRQLAEQHQAKPHLLSVPLRNPDGSLQGVVLAASAKPFSDQIRAFLNAVAIPVSSSLSLLKRVEKNWLQQWFDNARKSLGQRKFKTACKLGLVLFLGMLIPMPYTISSDCEVQPSARRFVAAPFGGTLKECLVEPGDLVSQNQTLARIDDREIKLELAEIEADLNRAIKMRDGHVATHESGEARVAFFETERLRARNELLIHRNENLELRSPVEGVLISGDLQKAEGMPLEIGQSLFEIAPLKNLTIEIAIPEDDVRYVEKGMSVRVRLDAFPFESWVGTIERIHPSAEVRDNKNVFVAKVNIANETGKLRPGMRGNAKTKTAWRPVGWNLLHKPIAKGMRWFGW